MRGQKRLQRDDGPRGNVPVPRQDAEAIDERSHAIVVREFMEKQCPCYGTAISQVRHRIRVKQRIAIEERRPGHEERCHQHRGAAPDWKSAPLFLRDTWVRDIWGM